VEEAGMWEGEGRREREERIEERENEKAKEKEKEREGERDRNRERELRLSCTVSLAGRSSSLITATQWRHQQRNVTSTGRINSKSRPEKRYGQRQ
jgi:hypothetical protein